MRLGALRARATIQATGDAEEAAVLEPLLSQYINEGYDRLAEAFGLKECEMLQTEEDEPVLPAWAHGAIADYASWMLMRNGNAQRQSRGLQFRAAFEEARARALRAGRSRFTGIHP